MTEFHRFTVLERSSILVCKYFEKTSFHSQKMLKTVSDGTIFPPQDNVFFAILPLVHILKQNNLFLKAVFFSKLVKLMSNR